MTMLVDNSWMEFSDDPGSSNFIYRFDLHREDRNAELRKKILERDLPLADGKSGERVCAALWDALHEEDGLTL